MAKKPTPKRPVRDFTPKHPTQQHFAKGTSVQDIIARSKVPGGGMNLPTDPTGQRVGRFGQWSAPNYHQAMNYFNDVRQNFLSLPAVTRGRFNNDPYQLLRFVDAPENRAEALRLGLLEPNEEEAAQLRRDRIRGQIAEQMDIEDAIREEKARRNPPKDTPSEKPAKS